MKKTIQIEGEEQEVDSCIEKLNKVAMEFDVCVHE